MSDLLDQVLLGDALEVLRTLPDGLVHTCVTSPPYWGLRDYGVEGQLGQEDTLAEYVGRLVEVFAEVRRVLRDDGTLWLVLGDCYVSNSSGGKVQSGFPANRTLSRRPVSCSNARGGPGLKPKDLVGVPWTLAPALRADGWWFRRDHVWHKYNAKPESVNDRAWTAHEYIFFFSKSADYKFDIKALGHRFRRSVWTVLTESYPEAHFAVFPPALIRPCVRSSCPRGGVVLDPFFGRGTTGRVALEYGRHFVGIELNPEYVKMAERYLVPYRQQAVLL